MSFGRQSTEYSSFRKGFAVTSAAGLDARGRRRMLLGMGAAVITGSLEACIADFGKTKSAIARAPDLTFAPLRASIDGITRITVCTRPFRAQGPRLDVEQFGATTVVHNYGHGGSGWSLSWGSSAIAVEKAMRTGQRDIGVIGCGALGLTSATLLQRAGARVSIYAKELPPSVRSSLATGVWSPSSRICFEDFATPSFMKVWEGMARHSFETYQTLIGLPGNPVEFLDFYNVEDKIGARGKPAVADDPRPKFADLQTKLIGDLAPRTVDFGPGRHPFGDRDLHRDQTMMFNINAYSRMLMADFLANGGQIWVREFVSPAEFSSLRQKTLINATGYGARSLFNDQSITPVRGQLARMAPQSGVDYGLYYKNVVFVPRRDGFVFQVAGESDYYGFDDDTTTANRAEAELAVNTIGSLFAHA